MGKHKINDGLSKYDRYRLKDVDAYRAKKNEWAKTPEQREKRNTYMRIWKEKNKERANELARNSYQKNKIEIAKRNRKYRLKNLYSMDEAKYQEMLSAQKSKCKICGKDHSETTKGLHIDHDHNTRAVRGLLCSRCNGALGWYEKFSKEIVDYLNS